jgi:hypothetical protein
LDRQALLEKFGGNCGICGKQIEGVTFDIDHIVPRSRGGTDDPDNLRPTHAVCNRSKSANELASWQIRRGSIEHRPVGETYDRIIGLPNYVRGVRGGRGNPFVPVEKTVDGGRGIRAASRETVDELAHHGAYITDGDGNVQLTGPGAVFVIWPHVAMRHPRYNQNIDSGLDRARGEECGFVMQGKATHQRRLLMIEKAATMWLRPPPSTS